MLNHWIVTGIISVASALVGGVIGYGIAVKKYDKQVQSALGEIRDMKEEQKNETPQSIITPVAVTTSDEAAYTKIIRDAYARYEAEELGVDPAELMSPEENDEDEGFMVKVPDRAVNVSNHLIPNKQGITEILPDAYEYTTLLKVDCTYYPEPDMGVCVEDGSWEPMNISETVGDEIAEWLEHWRTNPSYEEDTAYVLNERLGIAYCVTIDRRDFREVYGEDYY